MEGHRFTITNVSVYQGSQSEKLFFRSQNDRDHLVCVLSLTFSIEK